MPKSVLLLGPPIDHRDSLKAMLEPGGVRVHWLPDSKSADNEDDPRPVARNALARLADGFFGTADPAFVARALGVIDKGAIDFLVAYWGTGPLADIAALKRARPHLRVALLILCYPLAFTTAGILRQRLLLGRSAGLLDAILCPSSAMADYLHAHDIAGRHVPVCVIPPCWPSWFLPSARSAPPADVPNIVYVGRPDIHSRTATAADDLRDLLRSLLDEGISVHHGESAALEDGHRARRVFAPRPLAQLLPMMTGFDASLVAYNDAGCPRRERLDLTVPDRLITGVAAGIPVALPSRGYDACREYLARYPAVIHFRKAGELAAALRDRERMRSLGERAWRARSSYTAEAHGTTLRRFLHGLLASRATASTA